MLHSILSNFVSRHESRDGNNTENKHSSGEKKNLHNSASLLEQNVDACFKLIREKENDRLKKSQEKTHPSYAAIPSDVLRSSKKNTINYPSPYVSKPKSKTPLIKQSAAQSNTKSSTLSNNDSTMDQQELSHQDETDMLHELAKARFLHQRQQELLTPADFEWFSNLVLSSSSPPYLTLERFNSNYNSSPMHTKAGSSIGSSSSVESKDESTTGRGAQTKSKQSQSPPTGNHQNENAAALAKSDYEEDIDSSKLVVPVERMNYEQFKQLRYRIEYYLQEQMSRETEANKKNHEGMISRKSRGGQSDQDSNKTQNQKEETQSASQSALATKHTSRSESPAADVATTGKPIQPPHVSPNLRTKLRDVLNPMTFFKFRRDAFGRISSRTYLAYVQRRFDCLQWRLELGMFDTQGNGYLTKENLEDYIFRYITVNENAHPTAFTGETPTHSTNSMITNSSNPASTGTNPLSRKITNEGDETKNQVQGRRVDNATTTTNNNEANNKPENTNSRNAATSPGAHMKEVYVITAARIFLFFLDHNRRNRVSIQDMITSPILMAFMDQWTIEGASEQGNSSQTTSSMGNMGNPGAAPPGNHNTSGSNPAGVSSAVSTALATTGNGASNNSGAVVNNIPLHEQTVGEDVDNLQQQHASWFSPHSVERVYSMFLVLDSDRDNLLSKAEISEFGTGTLTEVYINRVFEVYEMARPGCKMHYDAYLDFVLAMQYRNSPKDEFATSWIRGIRDTQLDGARALVRAFSLPSEDHLVDLLFAIQNDSSEDSSDSDTSPQGIKGAMLLSLDKTRDIIYHSPQNVEETRRAKPSLPSLDATEWIDKICKARSKVVLQTILLDLQVFLMNKLHQLDVYKMKHGKHAVREQPASPRSTGRPLLLRSVKVNNNSTLTTPTGERPVVPVSPASATPSSGINAANGNHNNNNQNKENERLPTETDPTNGNNALVATENATTVVDLIDGQSVVHKFIFHGKDSPYASFAKCVVDTAIPIMPNNADVLGEIRASELAILEMIDAEPPTVAPLPAAISSDTGLSKINDKISGTAGDKQQQQQQQSNGPSSPSTQAVLQSKTTALSTTTITATTGTTATGVSSAFFRRNASQLEELRKTLRHLCRYAEACHREFQREKHLKKKGQGLDSFDNNEMKRGASSSTTKDKKKANAEEKIENLAERNENENNGSGNPTTESEMTSNNGNVNSSSSITREEKQMIIQEKLWNLLRIIRDLHTGQTDPDETRPSNNGEVASGTSGGTELPTGTGGIGGSTTTTTTTTNGSGGSSAALQAPNSPNASHSSLALEMEHDLVQSLQQSVNYLGDMIMVSLATVQSCKENVLRRITSSEMVLFSQEDGGSVHNVTDEIFDMVKPEKPGKITLNDLVRCGQGDIVISMLTDVTGFFAYDNRESLIREN
eukprot:g1177.t1